MCDSKHVQIVIESGIITGLHKMYRKTGRRNSMLCRRILEYKKIILKFTLEVGTDFLLRHTLCHDGYKFHLSYLSDHSSWIHSSASTL